MVSDPDGLTPTPADAAYDHPPPHPSLLRRARHRPRPPRAARPHARHRQGALPRAVQGPEARGGPAAGRRGGRDRAGPPALLHRLGQERAPCRGPAAGPSRSRHAAVAQVLGAGAAGGRCRPRRRRSRDGRELRHRQRLLPGAPVRPSRRARARHGLLHLQQRGHRRPLRAQEIRRRAHRRRRFRRAPRQRHAGHLLERQEPLLRLHASDAALSRHRRALGDGRRQHLECAPAARRRRRPLQGGLRSRASCRPCATSGPTSC